jgi:NADP-dependent 3-hydroxy acid dehydrogenase YdfG
MPRYLVTGASRGIGRCVVDQLAALAPGPEIVALGRTASSLAALPVSEHIVADLDQPAALAGRLPVFDRLDGVVHCAGRAMRGDLATATVADWESHLRLNVIAVAELTRLLLPALRAAGGTVVLINSGQGQSASANSTVYAASKFALRALGDSLRAEEPDIRVSSIYPGRVATEMQQSLRAQENAPYQPERYLQPDTVARAVVQVLLTPADGVVADLILRPSRPA